MLLAAAATTRRSLALLAATTRCARIPSRPRSPPPATTTTRAMAAAGPAAASGMGEPNDDPATDGDDKPVRLDKLLANLGYGSRREVAALIRSGRVQVLGAEQEDDDDQAAAAAAAAPPPKKATKKQQQRLSADSRAAPSLVRLDGAPLDPRPPLTLLLHKPDGYVVTSPDDPRAQGPTVYDLLPERFGARKPVLGPAGRLDKRTSGLMVLTDDGQLAHRITSPKRALWKEYEAELDAPMTREELEAAAKLFASGELVLSGDDGSPSAGRPLLPARLSWGQGQEEEKGQEGGARVVRVRVCEGRYHQVRRMVAAVGREVVGLRRARMGGLELVVGVEGEGEGEGAEGGEGTSVPVCLAPGEWRPATRADLDALFSGGVVAGAGDGGSGDGGGGKKLSRAGASLVVDADEAEMHRRARVDARRREKRRVAKEGAAM